MKVKVEVTQQDIDSGIRKRPCHCPISLALARALPKWKVHVDMWQIQLSQREGAVASHYIQMRYDLRNFVLMFDRRDPVQPFTFEIEEPAYEN